MLGEVVCLAALATTALAQKMSIPMPVAYANITAGTNFVIQVEVVGAPSDIEEVAIVVAAQPCCWNDYGLGHEILYAGPFNPTSINAAGNPHQNFTAIAPNYFDGPMQIDVARFYLRGLTNYAELEFVNTTVMLYGASG